MQGTLESVLLTPINVPTVIARKLGVGFSGNDLLLIFISVLRVVLLRRAISWQFFSRGGFSVADNRSARMFGNTLGELCHGL